MGSLPLSTVLEVQFRLPIELLQCWLTAKATSGLLGAVKACAPHGVRAVAPPRPGRCSVRGAAAQPGGAARARLLPLSRAGHRGTGRTRGLQSAPRCGGAERGHSRQVTAPPGTAHLGQPHLGPVPDPGRRAFNSEGAEPPARCARAAAAGSVASGLPQRRVPRGAVRHGSCEYLPGGGFGTSGLCGVGMRGSPAVASGPCRAGPLPARRTWRRPTPRRLRGRRGRRGPGPGERRLTRAAPHESGLCPSPRRDEAAFGLTF